MEAQITPNAEINDNVTIPNENEEKCKRDQRSRRTTTIGC